MTEAQIAIELGISRQSVRVILTRALWKVARALTRFDREPGAILGPRWATRAVRCRQKACSRCGAPGHQRTTCGRAPKDGHARRYVNGRRVPA